MKKIDNSQDIIKFFTNISDIWQNHIDYNFFDDIKLSEEQIKIINQEEEQMLINGYAGTGKSITLLYKFINTILRESQRKKILYISYNQTLISDIKKRLMHSKDYLMHYKKHDIEICTYHEMAYKLLRELNFISKEKAPRLTQEEIVRQGHNAWRRIYVILEKYKNENSEEYKSLKSDERLFSTHTGEFVRDEIRWMKENGFVTEKEYLDVERTGRSRSVRLTKKQRHTIFKIFSEYNKALKEQYRDTLDLEDYALRILRVYKYIDDSSKYDYVFIDEVQDFQAMQIKTLALLTKKSLVISGDPRQTIHRRTPYSYEKLGINLNEKGRRKLLNRNYRCSAETMKLASSLKFANDEFKEDSKTKFVRNGNKPLIIKCRNENNEIDYVIRLIKNILREEPNSTVAIIHRDEDDVYNSESNNEKLAKLKLNFDITTTKRYYRFDRNSQRKILYISAYDVKGLEFDYVFLIQFDDKHYPQRYKIDALEKNDIKDEVNLTADIEEIKNIGKKLLYVAMTRAKKDLYMTYSGRISEYSDDFNIEDYDYVKIY